MATHVHLVLLASLLAVVSQSQPINFTYNGFNGSDMDVKSDAKVRPSGAIQLTSQSDLVIGYAFFPRPLRLPINTTTASCSLSFSTQFVFTIIPPSSGRGGYGLAFFLSPSNQFPGAEARHYLGLFNSLNDGNSSNHIFAVEFDTVKGHNEPEDYDANHIGINLNGMSSNITEMAAYTRDGTEVKRDVALGGGKPIQAWIDYDGVNKYINVTVSPIDISKPEKPLISKEINLSSVLQEKMFVGFSAATGTRPKSSSHYLLAWSFSTEGVARPINISMIPVPPVEGKLSSFQLSIKVLLGFLSVLIVILVVTLLIVFKRRLQFDRLEDWELDCPHRFNYRDLHEATKGFGDSELVGSGGFGTVYKGVMPSSGAEVAVKRIAKHSIQGLREFAAEIESLGRLRHKNLVNLQGWCKRKNDLLLIYDYIPNGSLDSLLLNPKHDFVLCWERRFNIVRGIAAGLLYLHEEWEKVVIHRDVKSSNVLIDAEMNARLGDFGLARLYDHGEISSRTTNVVGTI
ncbi:Non-specific serine/threonine protein kinase, partial [Bertholletia excelsa]